MPTMSEIELQRIHELELDMFKVFVEICNRENLPYYLLGGSCLGAVRHQGFIPWDDDMDVGLLRADYEKFLRVADKYLPEYMFLQTNFTDPEYPMLFAKIRNNNTTFIESSARKVDINHGVYIDIFPIDNYPKSYLLGKCLCTFMSLCNVRVLQEYYKLVVKKTFLKKFVFFIFNILFPDVEKLILKREKIVKSVLESGEIINWGGAWGIKEKVPALWFGEPAGLMFEGIKVKVPKEYDAYLTQLYGDYMQLPPEEKREGHHFSEKIDFDRPYTVYKELYGRNAK